MRLVLATTVLAALTACRPDDFLVHDSGRGGQGTDTAPAAVDTADTGTASEDATLVGDWVSSGSDVSAVLESYYDIASVEVTFAAEGTYSTHMVDGSGLSYDAVGTWTASGDGAIREIALEQTAPDVASYVGIFEVSGGVLTYEVVQTGIAGITAPTVGAGFGSTGGVPEGDNVQTYRRP